MKKKGRESQKKADGTGDVSTKSPPPTEAPITSVGAIGPKVVYQNPDDPFGKKEVFVPAPRKLGSVAAMAKMFNSNVGLEDQSVETKQNFIGIPNNGNSCHISSTVQEKV